MPYIGTKIGKGITRGEAWIAVRYSNGDPAQNFDESYRTPRIDADWPDNIIRAREVLLNALSVDAIVLGIRNDAPIQPTPTVDELAKQAFLVLCQNYREIKAQIDGAIGKATTQDLDTAIANIKTAYKDEYAAFIIGLF